MGLIRFLLACIVILWHTSTIFGYKPLPSDLAVQCFYLISGFYISLILNEKYPHGSNKLFYKNRALKIYPLYWTILILLIMWAGLVNILGYPSIFWIYDKSAPLTVTSWMYLIISNIFIFGLDISFLLGLKDGHFFFTKYFNSSSPNVHEFIINGVAWSVGVELLFYVIAPYILRKKVYLIIVILLCSLSLRIILHCFGLSGQPWNYRFFPTQLMFFMAGSCSYRIFCSLKEKNNFNKSLKIQFLLLLTILLTYSYFSTNSYWWQSFLFVSLMLLIPASFQISKNNKFDKYLGNLSYPVYISQVLVINITTAKAFPKLINWGVTSILITILLSIIIYKIIIKPIENIRQLPFR